MGLDKLFQINVVLVITERINRSFAEAQPRKIYKELNVKN